MSTLVNSNTTIHQQHSWQSKGQTFDEFIVFLEKKIFFIIIFRKIEGIEISIYIFKKFGDDKNKLYCK